jgi:hypothetical protein
LSLKDELLRRYLRYVNCAEALRVIAEDTTDKRTRDELMVVAGQFEEVAVSLNAILRAKADLEA